MHASDEAVGRQLAAHLANDVWPACCTTHPFLANGMFHPTVSGNLLCLLPSQPVTYHRLASPR